MGKSLIILPHNQLPFWGWGAGVALNRVGNLRLSFRRNPSALRCTPRAAAREFVRRVDGSLRDDKRGVDEGYLQNDNPSVIARCGADGHLRHDNRDKKGTPRKNRRFFIRRFSLFYPYLDVVQIKPRSCKDARKYFNLISLNSYYKCVGIGIQYNFISADQ